MKITALEIIADPKPWRTGGDTLIAKFNVEYAGLRITNCLLIRVSRGFLLAQLPRGTGRDEGKRLIEIIDPEIRKALAESAYQAFTMLGGTEQTA
ncbi:MULTISPECIES: hypothetical protein [Rhodopseudomonas]|uniref:SpoVG family protein n=1 Tax=Rhodopseudomonas palustris TaxID=1076 RepID=A0A0D7ER75_RHOPL|nr:MULTISPECIES: hypothetical protein [Rhodopseudomonas]KIZ43314.1 hypothetical protein OO17_11515 [Rhodopseudomonas palustris]MDF3811286.1 hypothetical protein [Rhodopseudomonas sp. BAL398]WOK18611.1 hypothetical protein RBJ75_03520 [Rhodopseudomonas sp. BAL398]